jgi:hypothetical protein
MNGNATVPASPAGSRRGRLRTSVAYAAERGKGGVVAVGQGVQIFLGGADGLVAEAVFDGLQVCAAGQKPGGVRVAQVVHARTGVQLRGGAGRRPDLGAPPVTRQVPVAVDDRSHAAGCVEPVLAAPGPVGGEGRAAVDAAAGAGGVGGQAAVPVGPAAGAPDRLIPS